MEIEVTGFIHDYDHDMEQFTDSAYNAELDYIGEIPWRNALKAAESYQFADADALRAYFKGAWSQEELASMSELELTALLLQFVAEDYLSMDDDVVGPDTKTERWFYFSGPDIRFLIARKG